MWLQELAESARKAEAVAAMLGTVAYEGYASGSAGVVSSGAQRHGMVEGGVSVHVEWAHRELGAMKRRAAELAREIDEMTARHYRQVFDRCPAEPITALELRNLEEYERKRMRKRADGQGA